LLGKEQQNEILKIQCFLTWENPGSFWNPTTSIIQQWSDINKQPQHGLSQRNYRFFHINQYFSTGTSRYRNRAWKNGFAFPLHSCQKCKQLYICICFILNTSATGSIIRNIIRKRYLSWKQLVVMNENEKQPTNILIYYK
jgi:hypothetical protein